MPSSLPIRLSRLLPALDPQRLLDFSPDVRRTLRIDISVMLLFTTFAGLTGPFTGLILRRELGATPLHLSVLAAANAACLLLSLVLARVVDSRRPLPYVVWPGVLARSLFLLVPFIQTPWPFVGVLVGGTLLGTISGPAQAALVQQVYPRESRGRALGTVRVTGAVLAAVLALGAGHLLGRVDYRWVFCAAGVVGMAASLRQWSLPVAVVPAGAARERTALREAWRALRGDVVYRRLLLASFVFGAGIWVQMPATPILLADVVRATPAQVGVFSAAGAGAALVGNLVWGRLADRGSAVVTLRTVYAIGTLTPLVYFVASHLAPTPRALIVASVAESLMHTGLDLVWMLATIELAGARRVAQYAAIGATLAGVRGMLGPFLGALVIETLGLQAVYLVSAALMATGAALVTRALPHGQNTPRYIEQPRQTSGGRSPSSASRNLS